MFLTMAMVVAQVAVAANAPTNTVSGDVPSTGVCVATAVVTGNAFTALPNGKWRYVLSDITSGRDVVDYRNLDEPGPARTRHADRYAGVSPSTATCTPTFGDGASKRTLPSFKIAFGGREPEFIERVLICTPAGPWEGYKGPC